jgi:hypothetical protein
VFKDPSQGNGLDAPDAHAIPDTPRTNANVEVADTVFFSDDWTHEKTSF